MSRFWQQDSSSDEDSSDNESVVDNKQPVSRAANEKRFTSAYIDDSDSESDNEVRVVKSQKDRTFENINDIVAKFRNAKKNGDWPMIQEVFNNANKQIEKSKMLIAQHGMPPSYIKMLAELEDTVLLALKDKDAVKKMKPVVSKALNQMKLQIKKHNENYKTEIADFRANPEKYEETVEESESSSSESDSDSSDSDSDSDSDSSDSDSDSDSSKSSAPAKKAPAAAVKKAKNDDDDSDFDGSSLDDDSDSSSSESEDDGRQKLVGRARWLKKVPTEATSKPVKSLAAKQAASKAAAVAAAVASVTVEVNAPRKPVVVDLTLEDIEKRVAEIVAARGRRTHEQSKEALRQMEALSKFSRAHGPRKEIPILMHLVSMRLESIRSIDEYLDHSMWQSCEWNISRVLSLLESNPDLRLAALGSEDPAELALAIRAPSALVTETSDEARTVRVVGSIESFVSRLADEYTKAVQQINPHTKEYVERLADEAELVELLKRALTYYKKVADNRASAALALMIVEHIYYMHDTHAASVDQAHAFAKRWGSSSDIHPASRGRSAASEVASSATRHPASLSGPATAKVEPVDYSALIEELCAFVFRVSEIAVQKTRALLCLVYNNALHDRYYAARDLFLLSHVNDFIEKADVRTQVLYNRTLAVLGLAAFRLGLYQKAHDLLSPLCSNTRWKELLAQGTQRVNNNDPTRDLAAEREERRRQLPYHMHVNPELLEATHLTCAMILELPQFARLNVSSGSVNILAQPGIVSKLLRKYLHSYRKQAFVGPPETVREHVLFATESILAGRWKEACQSLLEHLDVWSFIPGQGNANKVRQALQQRIQEEAVRCHLLQCSDVYEDITLSQLAQTFDLSLSSATNSSGSGAQIRRIVCRMIFQKELNASLRNESGEDVLCFHRVEISPLQSVALSTGEKLTNLLDSSERVLDNCAGGLYNFKDEWKGDGKKQTGEQGRDGNYRGRGSGRGPQGHRGPRPVVPNRHRGNAKNSRNPNGGGNSGGNKKSAWGGNIPKAEGK